MAQVCSGCGEIISQEYCCNCGTENGVITEKDSAYAEYLELIEEGNNIREARKQDCLRNGSGQFREWNVEDDRRIRELLK